MIRTTLAGDGDHKSRVLCRTSRLDVARVTCQTNDRADGTDKADIVRQVADLTGGLGRLSCCLHLIYPFRRFALYDEGQACNFHNSGVAAARDE